MKSFPAATLVTFLVLSTPAWAHRFHVSLAEADHDAERGSLEVALRITDHDLEDALRKRHGRQHRLRIDAAGERDARDYVAEHFVVSPPGGPPLELEWVGWEWSGGSTWLYFEFRVQGDFNELQLTNSLFFELSSKQVNTVNVRSGESRHTLTFVRKTPRQSLGLSEDSQPQSANR